MVWSFKDVRFKGISFFKTNPSIFLDFQLESDNEAGKLRQKPVTK